MSRKIKEGINTSIFFSNIRKKRKAKAKKCIYRFYNGKIIICTCSEKFGTTGIALGSINEYPCSNCLCKKYFIDHK